MKRTNRLSAKRLFYVLLIALEFITGFLGVAYFSDFLFDQLLALLIVSICFFLIFVLQLIRRRLKDELPETSFTTYGRIAFSVLLCFACLFINIRFARLYFVPFMVIPLLLVTVLDKTTSITLSIYYLLLYTISQNANTYEISCYLLLIIFAVSISDYLMGESLLERFFSNILIFFISILVPIIFYYYNFTELMKNIFFYSLQTAIVTVIVSAIFVPVMHKTIINMQTDIYDILLEPSYELANEIRKFSFIEYQHARRVSRLSALCAGEIKANQKLAACGGFYYRLGKIEGEPMINNAIKIANNHCFPDDLIMLISEYGGIISLPTTKESAIVHMVDSIVTKVELFDQDSMTSAWNQNMVIYQTINELSQKGLYDESGLTMNQFLRIREILANEDILNNDNLS